MDSLVPSNTQTTINHVADYNLGWAGTTNNGTNWITTSSIAWTPTQTGSSEVGTWQPWWVFAPQGGSSLYDGFAFLMGNGSQTLSFRTATSAKPTSVLMQIYSLATWRTGEDKATVGNLTNSTIGGTSFPLESPLQDTSKWAGANWQLQLGYVTIVLPIKPTTAYTLTTTITATAGDKMHSIPCIVLPKSL